MLSGLFTFQPILNLLINYFYTLTNYCRYVSEFESTLIDGAVTESDADYASRLVGNPIHAFNLMRRFSIDIPNIEKDIKEDDWKGWLEIS